MVEREDPWIEPRPSGPKNILAKTLHYNARNYDCTSRSFSRSNEELWLKLIAVIAVAPTDRASFVYSYVQTRLKGQYNGK